MCTKKRTQVYSVMFKQHMNVMVRCHKPLCHKKCICTKQK